MLPNDDEESYSGMSDYDTGREAPEEGDDHHGCGDPYCGILYPACDNPFDEDQYPDNGEDDD